MPQGKTVSLIFCLSLKMLKYHTILLCNISFKTETMFRTNFNWLHLIFYFFKGALVLKDISFLPAFFVTSLIQQIKKLEEGMNSNFWLELLQFTLKKKKLKRDSNHPRVVEEKCCKLNYTLILQFSTFWYVLHLSSLLK